MGEGGKFGKEDLGNSRWVRGREAVPDGGDLPEVVQGVQLGVDYHPAGAFTQATAGERRRSPLVSRCFENLDKLTMRKI